MSNWEAFPLSELQLRYAAVDAWAGLVVHEFLADTTRLAPQCVWGRCFEDEFDYLLGNAPGHAGEFASLMHALELEQAMVEAQARE